jgi:glycosyltransferase involved in cell wall biosynthesis
MKILQVITKNELGGAQSVVIHLANALITENEVIVAAGEGDGLMFSLLSSNVKTERINHLVRRVSPLDDIIALIEMRRLYQKYHPDIIHLHSTKAGLLGRIAFPRKRILYTVHGFDSVRLAFRAFLPVERLMQWFCGYIVGVSKYDERSLLSEGIKHNVTYIYNGIPMPEES